MSDGSPPALPLYANCALLRATAPIEFDEFPGPVIRGALGDDAAVYAALFRPPPVLPQRRFADPPRPLLLRPRFCAGRYGEGSALELDLTLVGAAGAHLPAIIRALARLGAHGLGPARHAGGGCFTLERVDALGPGGATSPIVTPDGRVRAAPLPWRFPHDFAGTPEHPAPATSSFVLELRSPTFVRRGDEPRGTLEFRAVVDDLLRRVSLLSQAYGEGPVYPREAEREMLAAASAVPVADAAVRWLEVPRFSRTQRSPMTFGGWMGWVRYSGDPAPWRALLRAARLLHVGKHAAFGFGEVLLKEEHPAGSPPGEPPD